MGKRLGFVLIILLIVAITGGGVMAYDARPFDTVLNTSVDWRTIWGSMFNGEGNRGPFYGYEGGLETTAPGASMTVNAAKGAAMLNGVWFKSDAIENLTIAAAPLMGSGDNRIDMVIARITYASKSGELAVLTGSAAPAPVPPTLTQTAVTYEIPLAEVYVAEGVTVVTNANITDKREFCLFFADHREFDAVVATTGGDYTTVRDAVAAGAKTIWVATDTTEGNGNITLPAETTVMGAGRDAVTLYFGAGGIVTGDFCHIEEIGVDVTTVSVEYTIDAGDDSVIKGCRITGNRQGISVGARSEATGNVGDAVNGIGIYALVAPNAKITGNHFADCAADGIKVTSSSQIIIQGNTILNPTADGIFLDDVTESVVSDNAVSSAVNGIYLDAASGGDRNTISNNAIKLCSADGLNINGSKYNAISGNAVTSNGGDGISINSNSDYNTLSGNVFGNNTGYGINITTVNCDYNVAVANSLYSNASGALNDSGTNTEAAHNVP